MLVMVLVTASLLVSSTIELTILMGCVLSENNRVEAMIVTVVLLLFIVLNLITLVLYHAH
jgi:hypothetical protein